MAIRRIVANLAAPDPDALASFYAKVFGLTRAFDMDRIAILTSGGAQPPEVHLAAHGGEGTALPAITIGVDDLAETETAVREAGAEVVYGPVDEPWGLRRSFFRDPAGNLINVVDH